MAFQVIQCYARGHPGAWEGFCVDFDLAVQGKSLEEVQEKMKDQILLYLEHVLELPEAERATFLRRRAPLTRRLSLLFQFVVSLIRHGRRRDGDEIAMYSVECQQAA